MKTANILTEVFFNDAKPVITVLFETETTKEIRIAFKSGVTMKKHKTGFPITVTMVKGSLDFGLESGVHNLEEGDIIYLEGGVPHDLTAKTDSIVRLTLSKADSVSRVEKVVEK